MPGQLNRLTALQANKLERPVLYGDGGGRTLHITRAGVESVLGWATTSGYRTGENPAHWKGHLENLLANISKTSRTKNHPSLPWHEIGDFMTALHKKEGTAARAVEFTIPTACRSGEVRGARWSEFDLTEKIWFGMQLAGDLSTQLGGTLEIGSTPGQGAQFSVVFPVLVPAALVMPV